MKPLFIIYHSEKTKVYIQECCKRENRKTKTFAVRRESTIDNGIFGSENAVSLIGTIKFDGAWRQYVFEPEDNTKWSKSCMDNISTFLGVINTEWRRG